MGGGTATRALSSSGRPSRAGRFDAIGRDFARHDVAVMRSCMSTMFWAKFIAASRIGRAPFFPLHAALCCAGVGCQPRRRNLVRAPSRPWASCVAVVRNTLDATVLTGGWNSEIGICVSITPPVGWYGTEQGRTAVRSMGRPCLPLYLKTRLENEIEVTKTNRSVIYTSKKTVAQGKLV